MPRILPVEIYLMLKNRHFVPISPVQGGDDGRSDTRINATAFKRPSLFTAGDYQFTSYYGHDGILRIGRRRLSSPTKWHISKTGFEVEKEGDPHAVSVIAVDGDGVLHLSWGMHNHALRYTRSLDAVTNDRPISFHSQKIATEIPLSGQAITYPEFTAIPKSGDLLLMFRTGRAGSGDYHLFRWMLRHQRWLQLNAAVHGKAPWISGRPRSSEFTQSSPYVSNIAIDSELRLHVAWTWRSGRHSSTEFKDYQSNHHIIYACSGPIDQLGPLRWYDSTGRLFDRLGNHAIDEANARPAISIVEGSSLINTFSLALDPDGEPFIATWYAPNAAVGDHTRQYMLLYKRRGHWSTKQIGHRMPELPGQVSESLLNAYPMARPAIAIYGTRIALVFADYQNGSRVTTALSDIANLDQWTFQDLTQEDCGLWEPSYDVTRLSRDGILSLFYQRSGLASAASPSAVIDIDMG